MKREVRPEHVIKAVCECFWVDRAQLMMQVRDPHIAHPRMIAIAICRDLTDSSLPELGVIFRRHHTTILHAEQWAGAMRQHSSMFATVVMAIADRAVEIANTDYLTRRAA